VLAQVQPDTLDAIADLPTTRSSASIGRAAPAPAPPSTPRPAPRPPAPRGRHRRAGRGDDQHRDNEVGLAPVWWTSSREGCLSWDRGMGLADHKNVTISTGSATSAPTSTAPKRQPPRRVQLRCPTFGDHSSVWPVPTFPDGFFVLIMQQRVLRCEGFRIRSERDIRGRSGACGDCRTPRASRPREEYVRFSVTVTPELDRLLREEAASTGGSRSEIVRTAAERHVRRQQPHSS